MKKLSVFILLIAATFISCDSDSPDEEVGGITNKNLIIGKWNVTNIIIDNEVLESNDCELTSTLEVKEDGTYNDQTYGGFIGNCFADDLVSGTWSISGNTFTQTENGKTLTITILELTETTLKYEFEDSEDGVTFKEVWTFTKNTDLPNSITNGFIFNDKKYPTAFASKTKYQGYYQLTLANIDLSTTEYSGTVDFVGVLIASENGEIIPGSYTFLLDSDQNYDPSKNFFDAESGAGLVLTNGNADLSNGYYENISSGTITINKDNDIYSITYTITYPEGTFEGNYTGKIENSIDVVPSPEPSLIGKWQWISASENGAAIVLDECDLQDTYEFKEDGTLINLFFTNTTIDGQTTCDGPKTDEFKWSLSGDQLAFTFEGTVTETDITTITELSDTYLTIEYRDEETPGVITIYTETYMRL